MGDAPKRVLLGEGCGKCMVFKPICGEFLWKRRIAGSIPVAGVKSLLKQSNQSPLGKAFFFVNFGHYVIYLLSFKYKFDFYILIFLL